MSSQETNNNTPQVPIKLEEQDGQQSSYLIEGHSKKYLEVKENAGNCPVAEVKGEIRVKYRLQGNVICIDSDDEEDPQPKEAEKPKKAQPQEADKAKKAKEEATKTLQSALRMSLARRAYAQRVEEKAKEEEEKAKQAEIQEANRIQKQLEVKKLLNDRDEKKKARKAQEEADKKAQEEEEKTKQADKEAEEAIKLADSFWETPKLVTGLESVFNIQKQKESGSPACNPVIGCAQAPRMFPHHPDAVPSVLLDEEKPKSAEKKKKKPANIVKDTKAVLFIHRTRMEALLAFKPKEGTKECKSTFWRVVDGICKGIDQAEEYFNIGTFKEDHTVEAIRNEIYTHATDKGEAEPLTIKSTKKKTMTRRLVESLWIHREVPIDDWTKAWKNQLGSTEHKRLFFGKKAGTKRPRTKKGSKVDTDAGAQAGPAPKRSRTQEEDQGDTEMANPAEEDQAGTQTDSDSDADGSDSQNDED